MYIIEEDNDICPASLLECNAFLLINYGKLRNNEH